MSNFVMNCAEIVSTALDRWTAVSIQWDNPPPFGSLVKTTHHDRTIFAIISAITTAPADSVHTPVALGLDQTQLRFTYPHIDSILHTTLSCIIIGYLQHHNFHTQWPPIPAPIHGLVYLATASEYQIVYATEQYLPSIYHAQLPAHHHDELLLALLAQRIQHQTLTPEQLEAFLQQYTFLLGNEYRRLKRFVECAARLTAQ